MRDKAFHVRGYGGLWVLRRRGSHNLQKTCLEMAMSLSDLRACRQFFTPKEAPETDACNAFGRHLDHSVAERSVSIKMSNDFSGIQIATFHLVARAIQPITLLHTSLLCEII
jgi:hypothetical protein